MDYGREIVTNNAQETAQVGEGLVQDGAKILCLYGELGSGKTTFAQGFAKGLGIPTRLLSPTFIIVRRYDLPKNDLFYHIDLYRLHAKQEIEGLGLSEIFTDPASRIVIEWADRLGELIPEKRQDIYFSAMSDGTHKITIR